MSRGRYRNRPVLAGDISKVDFAEVEHAEHEAAVAREKVRLVKLRALLAAGWQTFQYRSPISEDYDREAYAPPGAKRVKVPEKSRSEFAFPYESRKGVMRKGPFFDYEPSWSTVYAAYSVMCRAARRTCGPTSCERLPRRGLTETGDVL